MIELCFVEQNKCIIITTIDSIIVFELFELISYIGKPVKSVECHIR